jgi:putative membrane protein
MEINEQKRAAENQNPDITTVKEAPILLIKGFLMGSADIVPGVSGGTMALILDIYERLLNAIKSVDAKFLKSVLRFNLKEAFGELHWLFLLVLFTGIFSAAVFFTKIVPLQIYMFTHPEIVYGLFFGLILGSIYVLIKEQSQFRLHEGFALLGGLAFGLWIVTLVPTDTPEHPAFVFLTGMISISAMILPGISGSYLLLIMRKYEYILSNISLIWGSDPITGIMNIAPFTLGTLVGIAAFSRVLSWLLKRFHSQTIAVLIGFMIGSLFVIWPYQHREYIEQVREVQELSMTDALVTKLRGNPNENLPEFERLGELTANGTIEVKTVKKKLISSKPYVPGSIGSTGNESPNVWGGIIGMIIGVVLVGGLDKLRETN